MNIEQSIAAELGVKLSQVEATITLIDEGSTVPFISRYRKEVTGGLDDTQLRTLEERLYYLRELEDRRTSILKTIEEQGKLTDELKKSILEADTKIRLEDLYAPYKVKRRTKAQIAREAGIEPLLDAILEDRSLDPSVAAKPYINVETKFADSKAVLDGARQIFMERAAENADLLAKLRHTCWEKGELNSTVVKGQENKGSKFTDYFEFSEKINKIPSHRALALLRGRNEGILRVKLSIPGQDDLESPLEMGVCDSSVAHAFLLSQNQRAADNWLLECARWAWRVKISITLETELTIRLRESADEEAIRVFGENMRDLLLAAPAGARATLGLDPGLRTGVKVVVVDALGMLVDQAVIYPHAPKNQWDQSIAVLAALAKKHKVELVAIGNGTASRETDKLTNELMKKYPELRLTSLVVSEAGASVYSASELAAKEFPDLDVTFRGSISIARRLQDPLAELVKIDPKAIGVGQYQHDVNQHHLARKLEAVVEDCVNAVGVDVNMASAPLLIRVAGLSESMAGNIVSYREQNGAFKNRKQILKVPRLGPKVFEQAAGFLKILNGDNPLDASSVHPEAYPVVKNILEKNSREINKVIGDKSFLSSLAANDYVMEGFGEPTVRDIIEELEKPGRDPRPEFKTASFKEGVEKVSDLKVGMILEGIITNVTNFGAFVDIGVHQDGLVHISVMADSFVKDPHDVVKTGSVVKVKVMDIDVKRNRIALSMRLTEEVERKVPAPKNQAVKNKAQPNRSHPDKSQANRPKATNKAPAVNTAMADAFSKLKK
ncbi:Transcription accessory protein (S1 RNA-binding domain) [hydrothermal vent metagenome]|uniref:Transcription accessory protein (S1 RNA-binding domain) n=1 Tax=hydrothermal vent metagenome TaxID=652676 RepID=A0A3B1AMM7_9ZZZZ